ncbi:hypothetical protein QQF64_002606 [Cirrhinus molitorella]|uniref:Uncharacterized protein n=1 Tax=Cirrhinus molitorella TaxID=172907 RepID=A0ABR3MQM4_9TELE
MGSVTQELSQASPRRFHTRGEPRTQPPALLSTSTLPSVSFVHHLVPFPVYTLVLVSLSHVSLSTPAAISKPFVFVLSLWTPTLGEGAL